MPALLADMRILILEDEFLIAMDVEQLCRDHGASEVFIARNLAEIDHDLTQYDAAIIDLMLNGVSTQDFARRLMELGIPFVFASGYSDLDEIETAFPGVALVGKPYSGMDLIEAIAAATGRSAFSQAAGEPIT